MHYAIRWLMHTIALESGHDRTACPSPAPSAPRAEPPPHTRAFPPEALTDAHQQATHELLYELLPERRLRTNPRVVKRKMSNYQLKRPEHRNPPKPTKTPQEATTILAA